ncbi:MAG: hypothetical protein RIC93_00075 [Alphaproteobacteria bacterium]
MNARHHRTSATDFWHLLLLFLFSAAFSAGTGVTAHLLLAPADIPVNIPYAGFFGGAVFGAAFCLFVFNRTRHESASRIKRSGPAVPFPRFVLNLFRYGLVAAAAAVLGLLAWTMLEDIVFARPLTDPLEMSLALFVSCGAGLTAFLLLRRLIETD